MRLLLLTLLAAISYAQTDMMAFISCEDRPEANCKGRGPDGGLCMMNYNKMPPRCDSGEMTDREEICANLGQSKDKCTAKPQCCWTMKNFFQGKCVPFDFDAEDCPGRFPRIFPALPGADTGAVATDAVAAATDAVVDASAAPTATAGADASAAATDAPAAPQTFSGMMGFMQPDPPLQDRQIAMMGCEMIAPADCNKYKSADDMFTEPHVCGFNLREGKCEDIELGKGNLCKTVADRDTCNKQGDCCWDMEGYCGELDLGDCLAPGMPGMPAANQQFVLPTIKGPGGMNFVNEEALDAQSEHREAQREMQENRVEAQGEMMGEGPMGMDYEDLLPVQKCGTLPFCTGRVGRNPCMLNSEGQCVQMTMPAMPAMPVMPMGGEMPSLQKTHESHSTSSPINYTHLALVLAGGLIVGLAAGMCVQGFRSKSSIDPVLLEDNYRNI